MTGSVDWVNRPWLPLVLAGPYGRATVQAMVDTGFSENLSLTPSVIRQLGLRPESVVAARLGDGSVGVIPSYRVEVEWVNGTIRCTAVAGDVPECLLGRGLLNGLVLAIDFGVAKTVEVR